MRKKVYFVLGVFGLINAAANNIIGAILARPFGVIGLTIGDLFSGTAIIFILLGWWVYRKEKSQETFTESQTGKYAFWAAIIVFGVLFLYGVAYGVVNFMIHR